MPLEERECLFLGGRANFGHFLFESLVRWSVAAKVEQTAALPVAVYDGLPARFYEFLDLIGLPEARRILVDPDLPTRFKTVWRASSPLYTAVPPTGGRVVRWWPEGVRFTHDQIRHRAGLPDNAQPLSERPILYVARGPQKWRRILNEAEVIECVKKYGGTPITLDGLSAVEQVQLVGNARAMILHSGAASAVSIFAPRDCAIVEFQPPTVMAYFGPLSYASCLGQKYGRLPCRVATAEESRAAGVEVTSNYVFDTDYWIDCNLLDSVLKGLVINPPPRP